MIEISSHSKVFLDTNILLYAVTDHPRFGQWCNALLDRIHRGDVIGYVSAVVLNEFIHKLIIGEVAQKTKLKPGQVIQHMIFHLCTTICSPVLSWWPSNCIASSGVQDIHKQVTR